MCKLTKDYNAPGNFDHNSDIVRCYKTAVISTATFSPCRKSYKKQFSKQDTWRIFHRDWDGIFPDTPCAARTSRARKSGRSRAFCLGKYERDLFRERQPRIWTLTERTATSFAEPVGSSRVPGTEIAPSTSMEIRYVNPRFLPAFILMPPHSMLIVDERLRTGRRERARETREDGRAPPRRSPLLRSRERDLARSASAVRKSREPTCNCNLPPITCRHCASASDRYGDSLDELNEAI